MIELRKVIIGKGGWVDRQARKKKGGENSAV